MRCFRQQGFLGTARLSVPLVLILEFVRSAVLDFPTISNYGVDRSRASRVAALWTLRRLRNSTNPFCVLGIFVPLGVLSRWSDGTRRTTPRRRLPFFHSLYRSCIVVRLLLRQFGSTRPNCKGDLLLLV